MEVPPDWNALETAFWARPGTGAAGGRGRGQGRGRRGAALP